MQTGFTSCLKVCEAANINPLLFAVTDFSFEGWSNETSVMANYRGLIIIASHNFKQFANYEAHLHDHIQ